jgi:thiamine-monophosphate kinase
MAFADRPPVTRAGAQPGDILCVTGQLGGSILGRHLTFTPRIREAQAICALATPHAMMDLSDGLATDLPRLCTMSHVGAAIPSASIPIHPDARTLAQTSGQSPLHHALCDGEDYELLLAVSPADIEKLLPLVTPIGKITADPAICLLEDSGKPQPWPAGGWQHTST